MRVDDYFHHRSEVHCGELRLFFTPRSDCAWEVISRILVLNKPLVLSSETQFGTGLPGQGTCNNVHAVPNVRRKTHDCTYCHTSAIMLEKATLVCVFESIQLFIQIRWQTERACFPRSGEWPQLGAGNDVVSTGSTCKRLVWWRQTSD